MLGIGKQDQQSLHRKIGLWRGQRWRSLEKCSQSFKYILILCCNRVCQLLDLIPIQGNCLSEQADTEMLINSFFFFSGFMLMGFLFLLLFFLFEPLIHSEPFEKVELFVGKRGA